MLKFYVMKLRGKWKSDYDVYSLATRNEKNNKKIAIVVLFQILSATFVPNIIWIGLQLVKFLQKYVSGKRCHCIFDYNSHISWSIFYNFCSNGNRNKNSTLLNSACG